MTYEDLVAQYSQTPNLGEARAAINELAEAARLLGLKPGDSVAAAVRKLKLELEAAELKQDHLRQQLGDPQC